MPGVKSYSKAHIQTTLLISDSTIGNMSVKQLKGYIDKDCEEVIVNKHPGATAEEIAHYSLLPLARLKPTQVIIVAGSNDVSRNGKLLSEYDIVDNILRTARYAKEVGTRNIFVSSVLERWGFEHRNLIKRINRLLESMCREEGCIFLDHSDITAAHICDDGLHLNSRGHVILKMNILQCFRTFNPYLCDFETYYEKCIL